jgi:hypothetical protein
MGSIRLAFGCLPIMASGSSGFFRLRRRVRTIGDGGGVGNKSLMGICWIGGVKALTSLALLQKIGRSSINFRFDMLITGSCDRRDIFK